MVLKKNRFGKLVNITCSCLKKFKGSSTLLKLVLPNRALPDELLMEKQGGTPGVTKWRT